MISRTVLALPSRAVMHGVTLLLATAVVAGCSGANQGPSEANQACQVVGALSDAVDNPQLFNSQFAEGSAPAPAQRAKFLQYSVEAASAEISGDTAKLTMEVTVARTGKKIEGIEWTAVKQDGKWKLKDTPLP